MPSRPVTSMDVSVLPVTVRPCVLPKATSTPPTSFHHSPQWLRLECLKLVDESPGQDTGREIAMIGLGRKKKIYFRII